MPKPEQDTNLYFVLSNPKPGREDEYNDWYDNVHLADVLGQEGIVAAQRFELQRPAVAQGYPQPSHRYLAIYEYEGNADDVIAGMRKALASGEMQLHDSLDQDDFTMVFWRQAGPRREAG